MVSWHRVITKNTAVILGFTQLGCAAISAANAQTAPPKPAAEAKLRGPDPCVPPGLVAGETWPKKSYALVIGMSTYRNGWDALPGAASDAERVTAALKAQCFEVEPAVNLTSDQLRKRIEDFFRDKGGEPNARLLLYFSGHVQTLLRPHLKDEVEGYVVPVDAPFLAPDRRKFGPDALAREMEFKRKALSMNQIKVFISEANAKWILTVFDSCFSGTLIDRASGEIAVGPAIEVVDLPPLAASLGTTKAKLQKHGAENVPYVVTSAMINPVVRVITAGTQGQRVEDANRFTELFVRAINGQEPGAANVTNPRFVIGAKLAQFLQENVREDTGGTQTPQTRVLPNKDGVGDFVFFVPPKTAAIATASTVASSVARSMPDRQKIWTHCLADLKGREPLVAETAGPVVAGLARYLLTRTVKYAQDLPIKPGTNTDIQDIVPHDVTSIDVVGGTLKLTMSYQQGEIVLQPMIDKGAAHVADPNSITLRGTFFQANSHGCVDLTFNQGMGLGRGQFYDLKVGKGIFSSSKNPPAIRFTINATAK